MAVPCAFLDYLHLCGDLTLAGCKVSTKPLSQFPSSTGQQESKNRKKTSALLQHGVPPSPSRTAPTWVLPTGFSSSAAPVWVLSMGYRPSGRDCSCMGCSPWDTVPLRRTCSSMGSPQVAASFRAYPHCCTAFFYPKFVPREEPPAFLFASVLVSDFSVLEPFGTVSVQHGGSLWCLLTEAIPAAPMLPKPCNINTMEYSFV